MLVRDCWFVGALSALCCNPKLVERVCVHQDQQVGVYGFVFHRGMMPYPNYHGTVLTKTDGTQMANGTNALSMTKSTCEPLHTTRAGTLFSAGTVLIVQTRKTSTRSFFSEDLKLCISRNAEIKIRHG